MLRHKGKEELRVPNRSNFGFPLLLPSFFPFKQLQRLFFGNSICDVSKRRRADNFFLSSQRQLISMD